MGTYQEPARSLLGGPTRRAVFELLARSPSSVAELAAQLPISRPAVSQHLRALQDAGLVTCHTEGTRRIYRVNPTGLAALRAWLDDVWDQALTAFHKIAEAEPASPDNRIPNPGQEP